MVYELSNTSKAEHLFAGNDDSMVRSCLQGMMGGKIYVTDLTAPRSAMAFLAEFAFFAGEPNRELASFKPEGVVGLVPPDERWSALIEECWPDVPPVTRYAIKKGTKFDRNKLENIVSSLPAEYTLRRIDGELYDKCLEDEGFEDNVIHFASKDEFLELGRGFAILKDNDLVSAASSYTVYREGIEIQIYTEEEFRRKGLASIAGAALILSCLDDGLYPSWDAANMESVHLAEKLGYELSHEYPTYWLEEVFDHLIPDPDKSEWDAFCGRYQHPEDARRVYEVLRKDDKLYYHFINPDNGMVFDLRMYPIGEKTFGINDDDFELVFSDQCLTLDGFACKKL